MERNKTEVFGEFVAKNCQQIHYGPDTLSYQIYVSQCIIIICYTVRCQMFVMFVEMILKRNAQNARKCSKMLNKN